VSIVCAQDTKYVNKVYLELPAVDSTPGSDLQVGDQGYDAERHFDGFEFSGGLDQALGEVLPSTEGGIAEGEM
jgi:hypothetical protein